MSMLRPLNRVLCALLALLLLVGGLLVAVEILLAGLDRSPWLVPHDQWRDWATTTSWSQREARLLFVGLAVVGLALLLVELWRRRPSSMPLAAGPGGVASDLDRRGIERWLAERVRRVEGVSQAQAEVGARVVRVRAGSVGGDAAAVEQRIREMVRGSLEELALGRTLQAKVDVTSRRVS